MNSELPSSVLRMAGLCVMLPSHGCSIYDQFQEHFICSEKYGTVMRNLTFFKIKIYYCSNFLYCIVNCKCVPLTSHVSLVQIFVVRNLDNVGGTSSVRPCHSSGKLIIGVLPRRPGYSPC